MTKAETWTNVGPQVVQRLSHSASQAIGSTDTVIEFVLPANQATISTLEHVQLEIKVKCQRRGALTVDLSGPGGTHSSLLASRSRDYHSDLDWTFMSLRYWGESPVGTWKLTVAMTGYTSGTFESATLIMYGTHDGSAPPPPPDAGCAKGTYRQSGVCHPCSDECDGEGCTSAGADNCLGCLHYLGNNTCVMDCGDVDMRNPEAPEQLCLACHYQCKGESLLHAGLATC